MNNSRILLSLLAIGVVGSFYYAWQGTRPLQQTSSDPVGVSSRIDSVASKNLSLDRFDFSGGGELKFSRPRRNLFNQLFPAPPPPKVVVPPPVAPPPVVVAPPPPPMPVPVRAPVSQMPTFQFIGYLEKEQQMTAFIALQGDIYLVKKDQTFADEFRVSSLSNEQITISRVSGAGEVVLPLNGNPSAATISTRSVNSSTPRPKIQISQPGLRPSLPVERPVGRPLLPPAHPPVNGEN